MFKVDDVVILKSGGVPMVVTGFDEPDPDHAPSRTPDAVCQWLTTTGKVRKGSFPATILDFAI
jgi:uncharacterized protein YodC (DUF2158 family)